MWEYVRVAGDFSCMVASTRALLAAFLAVIALFFGSTVLVSHAARTIDQEALFISRDASPAIEVLSNLRADMRHLEVEVVRATDTGDGSRVEDARRRIDALVSEALMLHGDAEQRRLLGKLQAHLRAYDETAERALQQARSRDASAARATLRFEARPSSDAAVEIARQLVDYEAQAAREAAIRIEQQHTRAARLAFELDALAAVLSAAAAFLCFRVVRQVLRVKEEKAILLRRKAEELEQFAGRVAHDIVSPLSTVGMSLTLAERAAPQASEALRRGAASLSRVHRIVDGLLAFARSGARPEHGARAAVRPVLAGLRDELIPFAEQHQARLDLGDPPDCAVACAPGVLLSLLGNLLRNGIKYLGDRPRREVCLRIRANHGVVRFEVEDTGPGIPAGLVSSIFEPYFRGVHAGVPGIGLGLATVKRLVESHGGTVGVRRGEQGGALFWFELAQAAASPDELSESHAAQSA